MININMQNLEEAASVTRKTGKNSSGFLFHDSSIYSFMKVMKCQLFFHVWEDLAQRTRV